MRSARAGRSRIINSNGGGYYDDVYVKTPKGWRFKSRNVVSDAEVAAHLTTGDFIEIRQLAGDDHGHYENLYGPYNGPIGPRSHMLLLVDLDGLPYIADVGFGGNVLTAPLRLEPHIAQATPHESHRLLPLDTFLKHGIHQPFPRHHAPRFPQKHFEQIELHRGQIHWLTF